MRVCMGGTFDPLHRGHLALLERAFEIGDEVFIGLTSDELASSRRQRPVATYASRLKVLERVLRARGWAERVVVSKIVKPEGRAFEKRYECIVVSPETKRTAAGINRERRRRRLPPLKVEVVAHVLAHDGRPISGTRIATGEIDADGRSLERIRVAVGTKNPAKLAAVRNSFAHYHANVIVKGVEVDSGVPEQPFAEDTVKGAVNRARAALDATGADLGVGIEAGLFWNPLIKDYLDVQFCAILDKRGVLTIGHGPGFAYPPRVVKDVAAGKSIGEAMARLTGVFGIGNSIGAVGWLSSGALDRTRLTETAIVCALIPRLNRRVYE
jgi:inosine/xanthosine triphosphatase